MKIIVTEITFLLEVSSFSRHVTTRLFSVFHIPFAIRLCVSVLLKVRKTKQTNSCQFLSPRENFYGQPFAAVEPSSNEPHIITCFANSQELNARYLEYCATIFKKIILQSKTNLLAKRKRDRKEEISFTILDQPPINF